MLQKTKAGFLYFLGEKRTPLFLLTYEHYFVTYITIRFNICCSAQVNPHKQEKKNVYGALSKKKKGDIALASI